MSYGLQQSRAGVRDRRIELLKCTSTVNSSHEAVETFEVSRQMWAEREIDSVLETYDSSSTRAIKTAKFRVQYARDITEKDRIKNDGLIYKILGIRELGRRELLELSCEYVEGMPE